MTVPTALVVNPEPQLRKVMRSYLRSALGKDVECTIYLRPYAGQHPRMRPHDRPEFQFALIDLTGWVDNRGANEVLMDPFPAWIKEDLLDLLNNALVIVLTPESAYQAVNAYARVLPGTPEVIPLNKRGQAPGPTTISQAIRNSWRSHGARTPASGSTPVLSAAVEKKSFLDFFKPFI